MTLSFQEETYSVAALCSDIRDLAHEAFPSIWVSGEVNRVRQHRSGHCYFELVEKGSGDEILGKLEAVAWRRVYQQIRRQLEATQQSLVEGQQIRCRAQVDFYPPFGRLQLVVQELDVIFSLGELARRRQETLEALRTSGRLELNKRLDLDPLPLTIGLITSHESAAYHDFLSTLRESGYGFKVTFVHSSVQGRGAETELVSALEMMSGDRVDCVVLIRGGGSRSDLAVFDSRRLTEAIVSSPVPVLTGLGHEIDQAIADLAAHTSLKTPTKVAEHLIERVAESDRRLSDVKSSIAQAAIERVRSGREDLGRSQRGLGFARYRLQGARQHLEHLARSLPMAARQEIDRALHRSKEVGRRLASGAPRGLKSTRFSVRDLAKRLEGNSETHVREWRARIDGWAHLLVQLSPRRTLRRGFSITRDGSGRVLIDPAQSTGGDLIQTELAGGTLISRVEQS